MSPITDEMPKRVPRRPGDEMRPRAMSTMATSQIDQSRRGSARLLPRIAWAVFGLTLLGAGGACRQDMHDQAKYEPLEPSAFFDDRLSSRSLIEGTVARGHLRDDEHLYTGKIDGEFAQTFPYEITREDLLRGQERYNIFCSPCHGHTGNGQGMIVQRGLKQPTSFHDPRLVDSPSGYYFDVMSNGFGVMYAYASRIKPRDRWAVIAYIRALQYSRNAPLSDLSQADRQQLPELQ